MQKFQSHKTVEAAKIIDFQTVPGGARLTVGSVESAEDFTVDDAFLGKHSGPNHELVGGYLVLYPGDGYLSWSPAEAFEGGYTPHSEHTGKDVAQIAGHVLGGGDYDHKDILKLAASALTQAPDKGEAQGLPVAGYKPTQPAWAIEAVNVFKELEERTLRAAEALDGAAVDHRLLAIGKTQMQGAFMFLARAIFQPQRVALAEDGQGPLFASDAKGG